MINRERLSLLWAQPEFDMIRKELVAQMPPLPEWTPGRTLEQWAGETELRRGYMLALNNLGVKID